MTMDSRPKRVAWRAGALGLAASFAVALGACKPARDGSGPEPGASASTGVAPASAPVPTGGHTSAPAPAGVSARGSLGMRFSKDDKKPGGVDVVRVYATGPAGKAGILAGDRVEKVDGIAADEAAAFERLQHPPTGARLELALRHGAEARTVTLEAEGELFGKPAPELAGALPVTGELKGGLASLRGRVVLLDFWASFCGPCRAASAELARLVTELGSAGLSVVGVAEEDPESARGAAKEWPLTYPSLADEPRIVGDRYMVGSLPTLFVIDRKGVVRGMLVSYGKDSLGAVEHHVKKLLAEAP